MGLFTSKLVKDAAVRPVNRLFTEAFQKMGAVSRKPDTRTKEELVQTIDYYTERMPELKRFSEEIKGLNPKHMGTIADTMELSSYRAMLPINIDMSKISSRGVSYRQAIIEDMIEASKTNPEAMELADAIINNTDLTTMKYVLSVMTGGILKDKNLAKQMQETAKIVPDIAKETLRGHFKMDFAEQESFMDMVKIFVNRDAKPDKITSLIKDLSAAVDNLAGDMNFNIYMDKYVNSNAPIEKIRENIKTLPDVVKMLGDKVKNFDIVDFVTKNTNLY